MSFHSHIPSLCVSKILFDIFLDNLRAIATLKNYSTITSDTSLCHTCLGKRESLLQSLDYELRLDLHWYIEHGSGITVLDLSLAFNRWPTPPSFFFEPSCPIVRELKQHRRNLHEATLKAPGKGPTALQASRQHQCARSVTQAVWGARSKSLASHFYYARWSKELSLKRADRVTKL